MDSHQPDRILSDRGVSSVQFLLASGLGLVLFLVLANLIVVQYGRGAIRSALDQGVREGAVTSSAARCEARANDVLDQLLGGSMGHGVVVDCELGPSHARATGSAVFPSWTPLSPDFTVHLSAVAARGASP